MQRVVPQCLIHKGGPLKPQGEMKEKESMRLPFRVLGMWAGDSERSTGRRQRRNTQGGRATTKEQGVHKKLQRWGGGGGRKG